MDNDSAKLNKVVTRGTFVNDIRIFRNYMHPAANLQKCKLCSDLNAFKNKIRKEYGKMIFSDRYFYFSYTNRFKNILLYG